MLDTNNFKRFSKDGCIIIDIHKILNSVKQTQNQENQKHVKIYWFTVIGSYFELRLSVRKKGIKREKLDLKLKGSPCPNQDLDNNIWINCFNSTSR